MNISITRLTTVVGTLAIVMGMGCGGKDSNLLSSSDAFSSIDGAAEAIATLEANAIGPELLVLAEDIEDVSSSTEPLPTERPRPNLERLQDALGLTDDQVTDIEAIIDASRALRDPIIEQVRDGSLARADAKDQLKAIREDTRAQINGILTDDQIALFEELRANHGRQFNRRSVVDFLGLTDDQATQFESIMQSFRDQIMVLREQVEAENLTRDEAREQIKALRETELEELSAVLNEEQLAKFSRVLNHKRFGFGPRGFGRGLRGEFIRPGMSV